MSTPLILGCQCRRLLGNTVKRKFLHTISHQNKHCHYKKNVLSSRIVSNWPNRLHRSFSSSATNYSNQEESHDNYTADESEFYDIVISGGGMVGMSLASAIGQDAFFAEKKLLLLETMPKAELLTLTDKYSNRVCALSPATVEFLSEIGAWDEIEVMRAQPVRRMQVARTMEIPLDQAKVRKVWDACSDAMITFDREEGPLAHIVENDVILDALTRSLVHSEDSVVVRYDTRVKEYQLPHKKPGLELVHIQLNDGRKIKTKLLVGADGANSFLRQSAGIHHVGWEYGKAGIVATLHLSEDEPNHCAWQRFLPTGPIALLPLSNSLSSLVWSTNNEEAERLMSLPPESFVDAVNQAYLDESDKDRISTYAHEAMNKLITAFLPDNKAFNRQYPPHVTRVEEGSRAKFPLGLGHASRYVESRLVLVGDSAHRLHPLAGQGVNLGFADASCLTKVISNTLSQGGDVGSIHHLLEYESRRQRHVIPMMATIDSLSRLYGTTLTPVVLARTLGLQATNALKPVKDWLMQFAMSHR